MSDSTSLAEAGDAFFSLCHSSSQAFSKLEAVVVAGVFAAASTRCPVALSQLISSHDCLKQGVVKVQSPMLDCPEELQFWWAEVGPRLTVAHQRKWSRRHQRTTELFREHRAVINFFYLRITDCSPPWGVCWYAFCEVCSSTSSQFYSILFWNAVLEFPPGRVPRWVAVSHSLFLLPTFLSVILWRWFTWFNKASCENQSWFPTYC